MLQLNGHLQRSVSLTQMSEWRRASQTPKAGKCTFLGLGRRTTVLDMLSVCRGFSCTASTLRWPRNVWVSQSADYHDVPDKWFTGLPRNESQPIWTLAIGSRQAAPLFAYWNTSRCQRACYCIVDGMVRSCLAWCLTHQAMKAVGIHQRTIHSDICERHRRYNRGVEQLPRGLRRQSLSVRS